jgi:hypothetical protein
VSLNAQDIQKLQLVNFWTQSSWPTHRSLPFGGTSSSCYNLWISSRSRWTHGKERRLCRLRKKAWIKAHHYCSTCGLFQKSSKRRFVDVKLGYLATSRNHRKTWHIYPLSCPYLLHPSRIDLQTAFIASFQAGYYTLVQSKTTAVCTDDSLYSTVVVEASAAYT